MTEKMRSVREVVQLTGITARTLHYYDEIGLLKPAAVTEAGYRMYGDAALSRLQTILLFRELEFPLKEIKAILHRRLVRRLSGVDAFHRFFAGLHL